MSAAPSSSQPPQSRDGTQMSDSKLGVTNGFPMLFVGLGLLGYFLWLCGAELSQTVSNRFSWLNFGQAVAGVVGSFIFLMGLVVLKPNESLVCLLFGSYVGTERRSGFWWVNPFNSKKKVSRRLETLECGPLKVNDAVGNPVDIGAVVVWRVADAAKAVLEVESYANYVKAQSETALRRMASAHPYDHVEAEEAAKQGQVPAMERGDEPISSMTLRDGGDAISESLLGEIRKRMERIGIAVDEARISHLAYSSEIAGAMLRKQAASAVVAARRMVVRGAVSIVEEALAELDSKKLGEPLDANRRAAMISNLLVVLVGDREVTPVINTGTHHS